MKFVLGGAALVAFLVVPVALGGPGSGSHATASGVKQTVKKLKQQLEQLQQQVDALTLQPGPQGPQGPEGPGGLQGPPGPSTGPAGGDLTGNYPNPEIGANAVGSPEVAFESLTADDVQDDSLTGNKVQDDSLTGSDINESTLGQVADAAQLGGKPPSAFMASGVYRNESAVGPGTTLGDGTSAIATGCFAGDVLLSGGPANIAATSTLLESFPSGFGNWTARINKNGQTDNFSVVVLCAQQ